MIFIIAEAGVNHNGDINLAKKLIDQAIECGADVVKFQTFRAENLVTRFAQKADYQKINTKNADTQLAMLKKNELAFTDFIELKEYCQSKIKFMTTAFDFESLDFIINDLKVDRLKIPSGEITNLPYLEICARSRLPIVLSTGMSNVNEIKDSVEILRKNGCNDLTLLHCSTEYPAPKNEVNLSAMLTLKKIFDCKVGYSDHTQGCEIAYAAAALGAQVIEKHFTLDKNLEGPDHIASLEPNELKEMIKGIRNIETCIGNGKKEVTVSENKNREIARKSIVAKCAIKKGEVFSVQNLTVKRPGNGISPMKWYDIMGAKAIKDFEQDELIEI